MSISINTIRNIFNTLPIGYYLGRRLTNVLSETSNSAYYDPLKDEIVVGAPLIMEGLNSISEDISDIESLIRGLLYHEVSHVILTPKFLKSYDYRYADQINIFEDERIETIMQHRFNGVNFKKNIVILNKYNGEDPKDADEAFYYAVRFRHGKQTYINTVNMIINKYSKINSKTTDVDYAAYCEEIINLYKKIKKDWETENSSNKSESKSGSESSEEKSKSSNKSSSSFSSESSEENNESSNESSKENNKSSEEKDESSSKSSEENNESSSESSDKSSNEDTDEEDRVNDLVDKITNNIYNPSDDDINKIINAAISSSLKNKYDDPKLVLALSDIINKKLKANKHNGSAINSYSGSLNRRAIGTRDDYKWWSQQNRAGHVRQYSKVHFNLFIDNSGSFYRNDDRMNTFIRALSKINNSDFSFDVITINTDIVEWESHDRVFSSCGGNKLPQKIGKIVKKHMKPACNNYNIVLFDGDAHSDDRSSINGTSNDTFKYFDGNNTIIISDYENKRYIDPSIRIAKVVYTQDYCNKFIEEIIKLLDRVI